VHQRHDRRVDDLLRIPHPHQILSATVARARPLERAFMELLWEITGWAGAVAILSAFMAVSMGWLKAGRRFQTANLLGACAFIVNGIFHEAWPSVVTNIAWFLISAVALFRMRSTDRSLSHAIDDMHVQFPGAPDTTSELAAVEVLTRNVHGDNDGQGHRR
jgi:hypothetical protein